MPVPDPSLSWWMPMAALGVIGLVAFLVPWFMTDLLQAPRAVYLGALMAVTAVLTVGYLDWSGTDGVAFLTRHWGWGIVGALLSGVFGIRAIRVRADKGGLPRPHHRSAARMSGEFAWEGLLYGAAEGVLLSVLPVLAAWQAFHLLGWTDTTAGAVGSGVLAVLASVAVIVIHHLGYREYRDPRRMALPIMGCGVLSIAYMATFSPIAPVFGHFLLHAGMEARGVAMPPYSTAFEAPAPATS